MKTCWIVGSIVVLHALFSSCFAEDWPTWRFDKNRSAATSEQLPEQLHLQWSRKLPAITPAWTDERLQFDGSYEPIVANGKMFLASPADHSMSSFDLKTGRREWRVFADAPVRFAPTYSDGRLYFGADDGCVYCLDASDGKEVWKFTAAPSPRMAIGNERLISVWPIRTGTVIKDGKLYFTAGVWPFEGTMLYELEVESGKELRVIDLDDQSPQGYLAANKSRLLIPGGRARAFVMDLKSGERVPFSYDSKGLTDYHVVTSDEHVFHGDRAFAYEFDGEQPTPFGFEADRPVIDRGEVYFAGKRAAMFEGEVVTDRELHAYDLGNMTEVEKVDRRGNKYKVKTPQPYWKLEGTPVTQVHAKGGDTIYAHHGNKIMGIAAAASAEALPRLEWTAEIEGTTSTIIVANERLIVVTKEGHVHCFGEERQLPAMFDENRSDRLVAPRVDVTSLIEAAGTTEGYCLYVGAENDEKIEALVRSTDFHVVVIDDDPNLIDQIRVRFAATGDYGDRIVARVGDLAKLKLPPYFATLVVCDKPKLAGDSWAETLYTSVRPYGGALCVAGVEQSKLKPSTLPKSKEKSLDGYATVNRSGELEGSADWTHEYGDPANTLMSQDNLVKAPLGLLWYGGPSSDGSLFFDSHDWARSATIIEGRMFFQGPSTFAAVDVYTGRMLWKVPLPVGVNPGRRSNWGSHGYHFVAVEDGIYLTFPEKCMRIDPTNGSLIKEFKLGSNESFGKIRVVGDKLLAPVFRPTGLPVENLPSKLLALDRYSGETIWEAESKNGFPLVAVANDKVFVYEGRLDGLYVGAGDDRRRGKPVKQSETKIKSLALDTGFVNWELESDYVASWLTYSAKHDVLLMSNKDGIEALSGQSGAQIWNKRSDGEGFKGHPENYWDKVIVWDDWIIDQRGPGTSYDVRTGKSIARVNPITGKEANWKFTKIGHHCNYAIANPHMMTFRAASAGFCNIETGETARLEGFRPGCRNSLIPACGVLNAPNFGYGCTCSYSLFTSLAMVHVPKDANFWTYSRFDEEIDEVQRVGINFGAPGDRRDESGTMWLDYPNVGGPSPKLEIVVETSEDPKYFRLHPSQLRGDGPNWVAASGVEGVRSVKIPVASGEAKERVFDVRLFFAEPVNELAAKREFTVKVQGQSSTVEGLAARRGKAALFSGIKAANEILIEFDRAAENAPTLISGIEVVAK